MPRTGTLPIGSGDSITATSRLVRGLLGEDAAGLRIEVYDGTAVGPPDAATTIRICSPDFFHRVLTGRGSELAFTTPSSDSTQQRTDAPFVEPIVLRSSGGRLDLALTAAAATHARRCSSFPRL